ncbi:MAG: ABC transporter ATP-binding protein [Chloroflexota bacterium]
MIEAVDLGKNFDDFTAVYYIKHNLPTRQLLAFLGPNGAGKTTTVRMLGAILRPTTGTARINGYDVVKDAHEVRHAIGMLTEQPGLYLRMTGLEYLTFYGRLYNMSDADIKQRSLEMFDRFAMPGDAKRRLGEYSKGMRQKVGLIRAMLHDPAVLLLDEPTSAMDPHSAKIVRDSIRALRDDKRTIILCTHNLAEAEMLADHIAIIKKGTIVTQGSPRQLKRKLLGDALFEARLDQPVNGRFRHLKNLITIESLSDDILRYRTAVPETTNPQLVRCLTDQGLGLISLVEIERSLEDVYLQVVAED